jgi:hypothetical protein
MDRAKPVERVRFDNPALLPSGSSLYRHPIVALLDVLLAAVFELADRHAVVESPVVVFRRYPITAMARD